MSEQLLRLLFVPGQVYGDLTFTPPTIWEIVNLPEQGKERIRGYMATAKATYKDRPTPYFAQHSCRLRAQTVYEWERLTGERLTSSLEPSEAKGRMA